MGYKQLPFLYRETLVSLDIEHVCPLLWDTASLASMTVDYTDSLERTASLLMVQKCERLRENYLPITFTVFSTPHHHYSDYPEQQYLLTA
jgi:hypothetical protein